MVEHFSKSGRQSPVGGSLHSKDDSKSEGENLASSAWGQIDFTRPEGGAGDRLTVPTFGSSSVLDVVRSSFERGDKKQSSSPEIRGIDGVHSTGSDPLTDFTRLRPRTFLTRSKSETKLADLEQGNPLAEERYNRPAPSLRRRQYVDIGLSTMDIGPADSQRSHSPGVRETTDTSHDVDRPVLSDEKLHAYTQDVIKALEIPPAYRSNAEERLTTLYRMLEKSETAVAEDDYKDACKSVLELAPEKKLTIWREIRAGEYRAVAGDLFVGTKATRLETINKKTRGDLKLEREAPDKSYPRQWYDRASHEVEWRLNQPRYRFGFSTGLASIGMVTTYAYGGKVDEAAIPINTLANYADTAIFKSIKYPWSMVITTGVWNGSSFITKYAQDGIDALKRLTGY